MFCTLIHIFINWFLNLCLYSKKVFGLVEYFGFIHILLLSNIIALSGILKEEFEAALSEV